MLIQKIIGKSTRTTDNSLSFLFSKQKYRVEDLSKPEYQFNATDLSSSMQFSALILGFQVRLPWKWSFWNHELQKRFRKISEIRKIYFQSMPITFSLVLKFSKEAKTFVISRRNFIEHFIYKWFDGAWGGHRSKENCQLRKIFCIKMRETNLLLGFLQNSHLVEGQIGNKKMTMFAHISQRQSFLFCIIILSI